MLAAPHTSIDTIPQHLEWGSSTFRRSRQDSWMARSTPKFLKRRGMTCSDALWESSNGDPLFAHDLMRSLCWYWHFVWDKVSSGLLSNVVSFEPRHLIKNCASAWHSFRALESGRWRANWRKVEAKQTWQVDKQTQESERDQYFTKETWWKNKSLEHAVPSLFPVEF